VGDGIKPTECLQLNTKIRNAMNTSRGSKSKTSPKTKKATPTGELVATGTEEDARRKRPPPIAVVVRDFIHSLRSIGQTAQIVLPHTSKWLLQEVEKANKKLEKYVPTPPEEGKSFVVPIESARDFADFTLTLRQIEELRQNDAPKVLARSLFMQMFSEFDAFTGSLLKAIYLKNHALLKGISREISLTDLLEYEDIDAVKRAMLDKEIESFRRDSYIDQFSSLERKFGLSLKKFKEWGEFVELSQRRNIFTHNGGMVSDQYLLICGREGYKFDRVPKVGDVMEVNVTYFMRALRLLSKVGLMLAYTLWHKVFESEQQDIHSWLNDTLYGCLQGKRWHFVAELEDFVLSESMRKGVSEIDLRVRLVNVAIALKFSGRPEEALRLLRSIDWSASYRDFKLAIAVLEEKYDEAVKIMKSIGKSGEIIDETSYHTWPLFTKFREQPGFFSAYESIYGEPFYAKVKTDSVSPSPSATRPTARKRSAGRQPEVLDVVPLRSSSQKPVKRGPLAPEQGDNPQRTVPLTATSKRFGRPVKPKTLNAASSKGTSARRKPLKSGT